MNFKWNLFILFFYFSAAHCQTFAGSTGDISDDGQINDFTATVSGLPNSGLGAAFGVVQVCLDITHTWDSDLHVSLVAPDGTTINLFSGIGGDGDNFTNTCLSQSVTTLISSASAPFNGLFRPQQTLGSCNNGQNGNGLWKLRIIDAAAQDVGIVNSWSIDFGPDAALPFSFTDSNLPIVLINTDDNAPIPDDPRILASMKIIERPDGARNYLGDANTTDFLNYNGRINIEIRGSSSQDLPKKSYGLTTLQPDNTSTNNVSLLGMPSENDWVLNSLAFEPSLIRDYISYNLSRQIGDYAPRTAYCEVVLNNEYVGLYLLTEKIKADSNRVNVLKIAPDDTALPNLSGGYITKADKTTGNDPVAWSMDSYAGSTDFIHDLPKPEAVTPEQDAYIHSQFTLLAATSHGNNTSFVNGYPSIIDVPTFVDFMVVNELASNVDGYQFSTYFHKDRNGKLRAGPVWDFNLTYGNDLFIYGFDRSKTDIWQFSNGDNEGAKFWTDLFNEPTYRCYFSKRWNELIADGKPLNYNNLMGFIDTTVSYISEAMLRENEKWQTIPNQTLEISNLKAFLSARIDWISAHIGSFSACNSVVTPALVIDKINYNPATTTGFPVSNDLEFIEIKNAGTTTVNLTGVYFKELGFTYKFPANSTIAANQSLYLASNPATFQARYGLAAFGQFTRNLSNKSQKLVLADAFGNTIDKVEYGDSDPWPDADGNGSYLQLISSSLDNALASSWVASDNTVLSSNLFSVSSKFTVYPNPVAHLLTVVNDSQIAEITIFDLPGNVVYHSKENAETVQIDFSSYAKGIYFIKVSDQNGATTQKIIR